MNFLSVRPTRDIVVPLGTALVITGLAILMTWPLLPNVRDAASDPGDPYINAFTLEWVASEISRGSWEFFDAPLFYPSRKSLAFTEHLVGLAILAMPLRALGADPLTAHNVLLLLSFVANGMAAYLLTWHIYRSHSAAFVAALTYAFVPYRFTQLSHLQHLWSPWIPVSLWALLRLRQRASVPHAAVLCASVVLLGLTNIHWLLFCGTALTLSIALLCLSPGQRTRFVLLAVGSLCLASLILLPVLLPYRWVAEHYEMTRSYAETLHYSAEPGDWLVPPASSTFYNDRHPEWNGEKRLFPGASLIVAGIMGCIAALRQRHEPLVARRGRIQPVLIGLLILVGVTGTYINVAGGTAIDWPLSPTLLVFSLLIALRYLLPWRGHRPEVIVLFTWVSLGVLGSLGLNGFLHRVLFDFVEPFRAVRVPARWAMITYASLSVLAGLSTQLLNRYPRRVKLLVVAAFCVSFLLEANSAPIRWFLRSSDSSAAYAWLASAAPGGGMLELPIQRMSSEYEYTLAAAYHRRPIVNGASGFAPAFHQKVAALANDTPIPDSLIDDLAAADVKLILVHADRLGEREDATVTFLRHGIARNRLLLLGRFEHEHRGDYVFAVRPLARPSAATEDASHNISRLEQAQFEDFAGGGFIPTRSLVGILDSPLPGQRVPGHLLVSGWAMSPHGIRDITVYFDNRRVSYQPELVDRPDVRAVHPHGRSTGFRLAFTEKPPSVSLDTDVQIRITDTRGRVVYLPQVWFRWSPGSNGWTPADTPLRALLARTGFAETDIARVHAQQLTLEMIAVQMLRRAQPLSDRGFVTMAYRDLLGREPDPVGLDHYLRLLAEKATRFEVAMALLTSEEFQAMMGAQSVL